MVIDIMSVSHTCTVFPYYHCMHLQAQHYLDTKTRLIFCVYPGPCMVQERILAIRWWKCTYCFAELYCVCIYTGVSYYSSSRRHSCALINRPVKYWELEDTAAQTCHQPYGHATGTIRAVKVGLQYAALSQNCRSFTWPQYLGVVVYGALCACGNP